MWNMDGDNEEDNLQKLTSCRWNKIHTYEIYITMIKCHAFCKKDKYWVSDRGIFIFYFFIFFDRGIFKNALEIWSSS